MKFISLLLVILSLATLLCSCGTEGPQGPKGDPGPAGNSGASFLTGKGEPSEDLGSVGDSYLDYGAYEWGLYVKEDDGWKLLGYIESEPAPLTIDDLDGTYALSHVVSDSKAYYVGDTYAGITLSSDMIKVELKDGVGSLEVNFGSLQKTNITCTIEYDMLIMICENSINITGSPSSVYELTIAQGHGGDFVEDGEIYTILEVYGDYYYVKKIS